MAAEEMQAAAAEVYAEQQRQVLPQKQEQHEQEPAQAQAQQQQDTGERSHSQVESETELPVAGPAAVDNRFVGESFVASYAPGELQSTGEALRYNVVRIEAQPCAIADSDVVGLTGYVSSVLHRHEPFLFVHDLRQLTPWITRAQLRVLLKWIPEHKHLMDAHLQGTVIVLTNRILRALVNFIIGLFNPPQPTQLVADQSACDAFLVKHGFTISADALPPEQAAAPTEHSISA